MTNSVREQVAELGYENATQLVMKLARFNRPGAIQDEDLLAALGDAILRAEQLTNDLRELRRQLGKHL